MKISNWIVVSSLAAVTTVATSTATAQEKAEGPSYWTARVPAPRKTVEFAVGGGYTQGLGAPFGGASATSLTAAGGGIEVQGGYRLLPELSLSLSAEYNEFIPGNRVSSTAGTRGLVTGANATYHFRPFDRLDPWARGGVGYRMLWVVGDSTTGDTFWHGFQFVKLSGGVDVRVTPNTALGPMVGFDLSEFFWTNPSGPAGNQSITEKRVVPFIYAGIQGRFDLPGERVEQGGTAVGMR